MISEQVILTRNKIIGVLLRKARMDASKSIEQCAQALACDPAFISRAEEGQEGLSLPQLESLAHVLHVPLSWFLDPGELPDDEDELQPPPYEDIMLIRRKIIGVMLRQARLAAGRSLNDLAPSLGCAPQYLDSVELGEEPISLVKLQALSNALDIPFEQMVAQDESPVGSQQLEVHDSSLPEHLSPEVREFIRMPINTPYLQVAMNLSQMPAETIRQIASGLLEITY